jgi:hypothetical protein
MWFDPWENPYYQLIGVILVICRKSGQPVRTHCPAFSKIMPGKIKTLILRLRKRIMINCHVPLARMPGSISISLKGLRNGYL